MTLTEAEWKGVVVGQLDLITFEASRGVEPKEESTRRASTNEIIRRNTQFYLKKSCNELILMFG
jgi:hypothetical protein